MKSGDTIVHAKLIKQVLKGSDMLCCGLTIIGCILLLLNSAVFSYMLTSALITILVCDMYFLTIAILHMLTGRTDHIKRFSSNNNISKLTRSIAVKLYCSLLDPMSLKVVMGASAEERITKILKAYSQQDQEFSTSYDAYSYDDPIDASTMDYAIHGQKAPLPPDGEVTEPNNPLYSHLDSDKSDIALVKGAQAIEDREQAPGEQSDYSVADSHEVLFLQQPLATEFGSRSVPQKTVIVLSPIQPVEEGTDSIVRGDDPPRVSESEDSTEASTHSSSLSHSDEDSGSYVKNKPPDSLPTSDHNISLLSSESQMIFEMPCAPNSLNSSKSRPLGIAERHLQSPPTSLALPTEESTQLELTHKGYDSYTLLPPSSFKHQSMLPQSWPFSQHSGNPPTFNELTEANYGIPYLNCVENSLSQDQPVC